MSTSITTSYQFVHVRYPKLIEVLTNNMNYVMTAIRSRNSIAVPNWYLKQYYSTLLAKDFQEVFFFWELIAKLKRNAQDFLSFLQMLNWPTVLFLFMTPVLATYGIATVPLQLPTMILGLVTYLLFGVGITMGYHRYFAHRSFDAILPLRLGMMFMGTGAFEGSVLWWCRDHRAHHRYSDTEKDPYGVNKGFLWAHIGWLLVKQDVLKIGKCSMVDLESDPWLNGKIATMVFWQFSLASLYQLA
jgi:fatty-acid desaturase